MIVLVSGGAGYIGSHTVVELIKANDVEDMCRSAWNFVRNAGKK